MFYLIAAIALLWWIDPLKAKSKGLLSTTAEQKAVDRVKNYSQQINSAAGQAGINPQLLSAVVYVESKGVATAKRVEPDGRTSYGLAQILCGTAREMGFTGQCEELLDPGLSLKYGAEYLKSRLRLYGDELGVLSYNTGSPQRDQSGNLYDPNNYIYKVRTAYNYFGDA